MRHLPILLGITALLGPLVRAADYCEIQLIPLSNIELKPMAGIGRPLVLSGPESVFFVAGDESLEAQWWILGQDRPALQLPIHLSYPQRLTPRELAVSADLRWIAAPYGHPETDHGWSLIDTSSGKVRRFDEAASFLKEPQPMSHAHRLLDALAKMGKIDGGHHFERLEFSPDGTQILMSSPEITVVRDTSTWEVQFRLLHHDRPGQSFFARRGLAILRVLENRDGANFRTFEIYDTVRGAMIGTDRSVASGAVWMGPIRGVASQDRTFVYLRNPSGAWFPVFVGQEDGEYYVSVVSNDGIVVTAAGYGHVVHVANSAFQQWLSKWNDPVRPTQVIADASQNRFVMLHGRHVTLWNTGAAPKTVLLAGEDQTVVDIALSPKGETLLIRVRESGGMVQMKLFEISLTTGPS